MNTRSTLHAHTLTIFYLASVLRSSRATGPSFEENIMSLNVTPQIHLIIALSALSRCFVSSFADQDSQNDTSDTGSVEITSPVQ